MILTPQTTLSGGRYIVQRHLDSGAMADVYLATDTQRAVSVALKVMRAELSLDEYFETYFQREASVLQQLQHPNIVRLYELVRIFGGAFRLFTRWRRGLNGSCVMLTTTPASSPGASAAP